MHIVTTPSYKDESHIGATVRGDSQEKPDAQLNFIFILKIFTQLDNTLYKKIYAVNLLAYYRKSKGTILQLVG